MALAKRSWILLLVALGGCASISAKRDIDRFAASVHREVPELPSIGLAVVANGRTVDLINANTPYYIASATKAYTGLAMAILAQRGQIDLDAPVSRYLHTNVNVTLRAFLTHTSGIQNDAITYRTAYTGEHTHDELVALLDRSRPRDKPGFSYDNLGYVVASLVMEQVTGKAWQQVVDELVFQPLGMTHTTAYMSVAGRWGVVQPYGISRNGEIVPLASNKVDETMHAAGGIVTTPADLARWLEASLSKGVGHGKQRIPAAAFAEAEKLQVPASVSRGDFQGSGYAFGWWHGDFHGQHALFHGGGYDGWHSWFAMLPEKEIGAGVMTNVNGPMTAAADLVVAYALDRLSGKNGIEAEYAGRLAKLKESIAKSRAQFLAGVAERSRRPWTLARSNSAYAGQYANPEYGALTIDERDGKLYASIGRLASPLEAFTRPETARVELTPGTGETLTFQWSGGDHPEAVVWNGDTFTRVP